jgi:hypothetical protein
MRVDFLEDGSWQQYEVFEAPAGEYTHHEFPGGLSAHWVWPIAAEDVPPAPTFITLELSLHLLSLRIVHLHRRPGGAFVGLALAEYDRYTTNKRALACPSFLVGVDRDLSAVE